MKGLFWILACGLVLVSARCAVAEPICFTGDFNQPIPASDSGHNWMDPVAIDIDWHLPIKDLNVSLTIEHSEVSDLRILLDTPWGTSLTLKNSWEPLWQSPRSNMTATLFDDESPIPLESGLPPYQGRFQPAAGSLLSACDGFDAFGRWTLRIEDVYFADSGNLKQWSLIVEPAHAPEPSTLSGIVAAAMIFLKRRRIVR